MNNMFDNKRVKELEERIATLEADKVKSKWLAELKAKSGVHLSNGTVLQMALTPNTWAHDCFTMWILTQDQKEEYASVNFKKADIPAIIKELKRLQK